MAVNTLVYDVIARDKASRTLEHVGRKFGGLSKDLLKLAGAATATAAVFTGVRILKGFIEDAAESAKISRITAKVIESTGGAAKVSAKQIDALAQSLSNKTAVDDELVQTGANLLLTFKNVRNEAGKGNKIFDQATAAALDLSAAGFGSVESASKMLGKALNDPLAGLTALSRAGVTFTAQQKETIKTLVEQGDLLGAQKIIMSEIASQVGGAAEAAASPVDKLKTIMANLGEEIGTILLPYLEQFADWLLEDGVPKIENAIAVFRDEWIPVIKDVWGDIQDKLMPILESAIALVTKYKDEVWLLVPALAAWKTKQLAVNIATAANPLGAIIFAVATLTLLILDLNEKTGDWQITLDVLAAYLATVPVIGPLLEAFEDMGGTIEGVKQSFARFWEDVLRGALNFSITFAETILNAGEIAFGWLPKMGPKFDALETELEDFRKRANIELSNISDEDIVINVKPSGLERVTKSVAASAAARGPWAGGLESGQSSLHPFTPSGMGVGGSLGVSTSGLDPAKVISLAQRIGDRAGDMTFAELQRLFKAGAFGMFGAAGPGIPGAGRLFPLPPGTYRRTQGPHDGGAIDYGAPYGTPVRASFSGFLDISDLGNRSYGKFYRLFGPGQRSILGAHLSSFAHGDGPISRGQLIGRVGSTGNSTGPHLHLLGFDKGGWLPPGLTLAYNGTGQAERVGNGAGDARGFAREFVRELKAQGLMVVPMDARRADLLSRAG